MELHKQDLDSSQLQLLHSKYKSALHKLRKLNPSLVSNILFPLYSSTGRPAIDPAILIRSFVLMNHLKYVSIHQWCDNLKNDSLLQYLLGSYHIPNFASHYYLIIRLTGYDPHLDDLYPKEYATKKRYKRKRSKGQKLINFTPDDTLSLSEKYKNGAEFDSDC